MPFTIWQTFDEDEVDLVLKSKESGGVASGNTDSSTHDTPVLISSGGSVNFVKRFGSGVSVLEVEMWVDLQSTANAGGGIPRARLYLRVTNGVGYDATSAVAQGLLDAAASRNMMISGVADLGGQPAGTHTITPYFSRYSSGGTGTIRHPTGASCYFRVREKLL